MTMLNALEEHPVFIHSGFRTSSTWLWSRFRRDSHFLCFYEIFNGAIPRMTLRDVQNMAGPAPGFNHPDTAPYFIEYIPILNKDVAESYFPFEDPQGKYFIPDGGVTEALDEHSTAYVRRLIQVANDHGKQVVLTTTGMLGKIAGLRAAFDGVHIILTRNLFSQWNSYSAQHKKGELFFIGYLFGVLKYASHDPFISELRKFGGVDECDSRESWASKDRYDDIFCTFVAFHVYFLLNATRFCDFVIDGHSLATGGSASRQKVEDLIEGAIGHRVDLSDIRESMDFPMYVIERPVEAQLKIDGLVQRACAILSATADERRMVSSWLDALWQKHREFSLHTDAVILSMRQLERAKAAAEVELASQRDNANHRLQELDAANSKINDLSQRIRQYEDNANNLQAELEQSQFESANARSDGVQVIAQRDVLQAEVNRLTTEMERVCDERERAVEEMHATRSTLDRLTLDAARISAEFESIVAASRVAKEDIERLTSELARVDVERELALAAQNAARDELKSQAADTASLMDEQVATKKELERLTSEISRALNECALLVGARDSMSAELVDKTARLAQLESLHVELKHQYDFLADQRRRLFEDLRLDGGPMALRDVLPLARALRPIIRGIGHAKRFGKKLISV